MSGPRTRRTPAKSAPADVAAPIIVGLDALGVKIRPETLLAYGEDRERLARNILAMADHEATCGRKLWMV